MPLFNDLIVNDDGALIIESLQSLATFLGSFGTDIPDWAISAAGVAQFRTLQVNTITGAYGASVANGSKVWLANTSTFGSGNQAISQGAADSAGVGFRQLRTPN